MTSMVKENKMVSPYFLFFLMHSAQTGVSVLNFQSNVIRGAGHDAWLSVLAFGLVLHVVFLMMLLIMKVSSSGDILSFHRDVFGNIFGGALNIILACYLAIVSLFAIRTYIDILQIWVFDGIASWEFSLLLSLLVYYIVVGGIRVITSIAFWGVVIPTFLLLSLLYLLGFAEVSYLSPPFEHRAKDYFISAKEIAPMYFGFETVLVFFPFIKNKEKAQKRGHLGLLYTTSLYTIITIITFLFFSQGKLQHLTWPTLTMIKIIRLPFLERFEFIFIFTWLLVVMPVICTYLWSAVRCMKATIPKLKPTYILVGFLLIFHYVNSQLVEIHYSSVMEKYIGYSGLILLFCYIPFLFLIAIIRKKMTKKRKRPPEAS
ncbi:GerAB/ArcD/ProY family transporter [Bacillus tuaregi]|uniref:GerAB/ArcD/ProY family transporter n=1 Tax=Bacillus tuaregi TaxID=1816695 RepID=UPI0008F833BF|nr:GerAB/ArcD/ProY family transporter [Bacillus tuaregi]